MNGRANAPMQTTPHANSAAETTVMQKNVEAAPEKSSTIKNLFDGLSISQVAAGALAAVTSMLLSAQIGIAGSVIGVAIGSVVSTVSSQLYKKFLAGSAEKIRGLASTDDAGAREGTSAAQSIPATAMHAAETTVMPFAENGTGGAMTTRITPSIAHPNAACQATTVIDRECAQPAALSDTHAPAATTGTEGSNTPHINSAAGRTGNASHATGVIEAEAAKRRTMQRRVMAVSVASSIVAILLFAGLVTMLTGGEGIGTKVEPFTGKTVTTQLADETDEPQSAAQNAPQKNSANGSAQNGAQQEQSSQNASATEQSGTASSTTEQNGTTSSNSSNTSSASNNSGTSTGTSGESESNSSSNSSSTGNSSSTSSSGNSTNGSSSTSGTSTTNNSSTNSGTASSNPNASESNSSSQGN